MASYPAYHKTRQERGVANDGTKVNAIRNLGIMERPAKPKKREGCHPQGRVGSSKLSFPHKHLKKKIRTIKTIFQQQQQQNHWENLKNRKVWSTQRNKILIATIPEELQTSELLQKDIKRTLFTMLTRAQRKHAHGRKGNHKK